MYHQMYQKKLLHVPKDYHNVKKGTTDVYLSLYCITINKNVLLTITLVMILHRFERSP
jgi:hypothetical protein